MFFESYFAQRGEQIEPNQYGEVQVRCPFRHSKGFDNNPSASFNVNRRIYKCFTCSAEGNGDGMSETSFIAKTYGVSYQVATKLKRTIELASKETYIQSTNNLLQHDEYRSYLENRGITREVIEQYCIGYDGNGIIYPVMMDGITYDIRTYNPNPQQGEVKMRSKKGAKPLLYPFDEWVSSEGVTILAAGENDTLLLRSKGFNAITSTLGEGSVPLNLHVFKGKDVYICYDCDEAGLKSSKRIAFYLSEIGAIPHIIHLGLEGTKESKDVTDFFIKENKSIEDFQVLMKAAQTLSEEDLVKVKNETFPLVELWNIKDNRYTNQYISSRVMQVGRFDTPFVDVPQHVEWKCKGAKTNKACETCPFADKSGEWSLERDNLNDVLKFVDVNEKERHANLLQVCGLPKGCPNSKISVVSTHNVEKVIVSPDVESESELSGYREAMLTALVLDGATNDGEKYRMYFKRVPHPRDQSLILIVDRVEDSDNAINTFKVTPSFIESMQKWKGDPTDVMKKRHEKLGKRVVGNYIPDLIFFASDIVYHSVLDFKFMGRYMKGHPEGLIIGASRTGKSEVGKQMSEFYQMGNITEGKNATVAGLVGGVEKAGNGTFRISWGAIPRNHKGMLFIDEVSGIDNEVFKKLTGLRSQRIATIEKIAKGKAPAKTRLLWVGNPRANAQGITKSLHEYKDGIKVCTDLFGADEDVARFDFIVLVPEQSYISPLNQDGTPLEQGELPLELRDMIRWVWSRNQDQVKFESQVERYIEHVAIMLNKEYGSRVKIIGVEATKKIARIAVSIAACCFSTDETGEIIVVKKEHVDWVKDFLVRLYDNDIFRMRSFVEEERKFNTTTHEVNMEVAKLVKKYPLLIKALLEQDDMQVNTLKTLGGLSDDEYRLVSSTLFSLGLIRVTRYGINPSMRLKLAVEQVSMKRKVKNDMQQNVIDSTPKSYFEPIEL